MVRALFIYCMAILAVIMAVSYIESWLAIDVKTSPAKWPIPVGPPYLFNDATLGAVVYACFLPPQHKLFPIRFLTDFIPVLFNVIRVVES